MDISSLSQSFLWYVNTLDFSSAQLHIFEELKEELGWLAYNELLLVKVKDKEEFLLVRLRDMVITKERQNDISNLIENYKKSDKQPDINIDSLTLSNFSFTTFDSVILWTLFKKDGTFRFGSDVWNFHRALDYQVYKPSKETLEELLLLVWSIPKNREKYGVVRYTSSNFERESAADFYLNPQDILARRTALFWMTRTGKSNSMKKMIETVESISLKREQEKETKIWQIIFDINGEYANTNEQDGTSIYEKYKRKVERYSFLERDGFEIMKINFQDFKGGGLQEGFELIKVLLKDKNSGADYFQNFLAIEWEEDKEDYGKNARFQRKLWIYKAILWKAWFKEVSDQIKVNDLWFSQELKTLLAIPEVKRYLNYDELIDTLEQIWTIYNESVYFSEYKQKHNGKEWADEEIKALFTILTGKKMPGTGVGTVSAYKKLIPLKQYHTKDDQELFTYRILDQLKRGKIIIVDLSLGEDEIKKLYSEKLAASIFHHNKDLFIQNNTPNYIQLYFEEAHNLFPTQADDLTNIYNRLAKEGAKYKLGLVYATQEASAIHPSILKNTENWFLSHLNNNQEIQKLDSYYDFWDYKESLKRYSREDIGYSRIKMLSYPFTIPVQIDKFIKETDVI